MKGTSREAVANDVHLNGAYFLSPSHMQMICSYGDDAPQLRYKKAAPVRARLT
ncbi:MAG: hypothetical protein DHS20C06_07790 [Hyphobacterium sp.]|nr:MAG: hypothetical protein DHS20C06_07790 [Hyphobacterium sp.]